MTLKRPKKQTMSLNDAFTLMCAFRKDERGTLAIFSMFMFIMIIGIMGIAIDYSRAERNRATLQHTLDRAILAAADLDQQRAPADVVNDYFAAAGLETTLKTVSAQQGLNYKTLFAEAEVHTTAPFLDMLGRWDGNRRVKNADDLVWNEETLSIDGVREYEEMPQSTTISSTATGGAEERVAKVEISLILDISGSMAWNDKMTNLQNAANTFVDTVLDPGNMNQVSVNLIPYSEQVNAGADLFRQFKRNHQHDYSFCYEFEHGDYSVPYMNLTQTYYQAQHFQWNFDGYNNALTDTICPRYTYEAIKPLTQDANALKSQINQLQPRAGTQIFQGLKWGAALLDPSFNTVTTNMVGEGLIDANFSDRPASYDDPETMKTIVLMTDGQNSSSSRLREWAYNSKSDYYHWSRYNLWYYLNSYVRSQKRGLFYREKYSAAEGDVYTESMCNAAKEQGVVIWTIGFEVEDHGASVMQNCASSPSHFFRVEGIEISDAFDAIARQINQLRLTQ